VSGVQALPLVHGFARSDQPEQRALFVRVYLDLLAERARGHATVPQDWGDALQACLEKAAERERDGYLSDLAKVLGHPAGDSRPALASADAIDDVVAHGRLDQLIALAANQRAQLRSEHLQTLAARAQTLARYGDRRLVEALLAREGLRLEAAPLFLEANTEQRAAILVAAQRAVLGAKAPAPTLDEKTADRLEYAAIAGDISDFAEALAAALGADVALAERISADPVGEPLAVALLALGAPRDVAVRVMTARDMQDGSGYPRVHTLARLSDRVSPAAAQRIMAALLGRAAVTHETPAIAPAAAREAAHPSPFLRREAPARRASPETTTRSAPDSQRPSAPRR
jgi:hypothetical protein